MSLWLKKRSISIEDRPRRQIVGFYLCQWQAPDDHERNPIWSRQILVCWCDFQGSPSPGPIHPVDTQLPKILPVL